ncbi:uncharacterized protein FOMMEDRAFT_131441 [Fomitiporia mediterranea MF3/22]|uniref:uncharacterized protein n=1 Tax=Fomitiporia mediterranea (strain MF3/22) TaxID=694068 RepID=UPI0004408F9F|nr:uncharacterized protein FOMMEDRAFT_131441 [Fomitiporia mediterranea MF3/22]EJD06514.1 hypothetical protein FOMMEDRAFT_131441 [Fomitiporia mediterranea MF3/22]
MSMAVSHPNFPHGLDIRPLVSERDENGPFNAEAQKHAIQRFGIAGRIWEAAQLMIRYFELSASPVWQFDPPCSMIQRESDRELTVVELGSGTGYVGLKLAEHLSELSRAKDLLVLTDLPDVCILLEESLHDERQRWMTSHPLGKVLVPVKILPLPWGAAAEGSRLSALLANGECSTSVPRRLTHVVCSDLVYFPHLLAPLLRTLLQLTSPPFELPGQSAELIISYKIRSLVKECAFWSAFGLWFTFAPVLARLGDWHIFGEESFVFVGYRRPESLEWVIPDNDDDLLAGIGALGTSMPKSDDTFETLLLTQMSV